MERERWTSEVIVRRRSMKREGWKSRMSGRESSTGREEGEVRGEEDGQEELNWDELEER